MRRLGIVICAVLLAGSFASTGFAAEKAPQKHHKPAATQTNTKQQKAHAGAGRVSVKVSKKSSSDNDPLDLHRRKDKDLPF